MTFATVQFADAMTQGRPVEPARGAHRAMADGEDHGVALFQWHNLGAAGPLRVVLRQ